MLETLEHSEHAKHLAHGQEHGDGHADSSAAVAKKLQTAQLTALLVAGLAAGLALTEQGGKHAEIRVQANLIAATDAWAQYQAKSIRDSVSKDFVQLMTTLDPPADAVLADRRSLAIRTLNADQDRFEHDPKDGKDAIAARARTFEQERDHALEQTHAYHNGAAAMELGIVLATASAIIGSRPMVVVAGLLGLAGAVCAVLGVVAPEWAAF